MRAFIAVEVRPSDALLGLLKALKSSEARLRVVAPENLHLTLKFLGEVGEDVTTPIVEVLRQSTEGVKPFTMSFQGTGAFPSLKGPRVLWVGVRGGDPLVAIARSLEGGLEGLGFPRERRMFSPHLTVARVKGPQGRESLARLMEGYQEEHFGEQRVEEVLLKRSELKPSGAVYSNIAKVSLG